MVMERSLRKLLAGGVRPRTLTLDLARRRNNPEPEIGRAALAALQAASPTLTALDTSGVAFTPEVAEAARGAAPELAHLAIDECDMGSEADSAKGVAAVLRHAAPHLTQLSLHSQGGLAPELGPPLGLCSSLTSMELHAQQRRSFAHTLPSFAELPSLTTLSVQGCEPSSAAAAIASLSRLTRLDWHGDCEESLVSAIAQIRGLRELQLPRSHLCTSELRLLSGLSVLTKLSLNTITCDQVRGDAAVPLPPQLEMLGFGEKAAPEGVAALSFGDHLQSVDLPGFHVMEPVDAATGAALVAAFGKIAGRLDVELFELDLPGDIPPPDPWASWAPLFEAMGPVGLRHLQLSRVQLTVEDVAALTQHLCTLECLDLHCCSVPLKALLWPPRLPSLRRLGLWPNKSDDDAWRSPEAVEVALLGLCMHAERLKHLELWLYDDIDDDDEEVNASVEAAVEAVRGQLPLFCTHTKTVNIVFA